MSILGLVTSREYPKPNPLRRFAHRLASLAPRKVPIGEGFECPKNARSQQGHYLHIHFQPSGNIPLRNLHYQSTTHFYKREGGWVFQHSNREHPSYLQRNGKTFWSGNPPTGGFVSHHKPIPTFIPTFIPTYWKALEGG